MQYGHGTVVPMSETLYGGAVEFRADESHRGPGRLVGTLMSYGQPAGDRRERFAPGSLEWPADGVVLRRQHVPGAPIMRVVPEIRGSEVVIDAELPDTQAGRDAASEVRDGLMTGLSVEFRSKRQRYTGGTREIVSAMLTGAGLVVKPSYGGARVEVRGRVDGWGPMWL